MGRDYVRFIILSDARTGSNLLVEALNSNPEIRCFREIFNMQPDIVDYAVEGYDEFSKQDVGLRDSDFRRLLSERVFCDHPPQTRAVGFKFHYGHFWSDAGLIGHLVDDSDLRIVHLRRANLLRTLVSLRIAEDTGGWMEADTPLRRRHRLLALMHPREIARSVRNPVHGARAVARALRPPKRLATSERRKIRLTRDECSRYFYTVEHNVEHFTKLFSNHGQHDIWYDDLAADRQAGVDGVARFLGVSTAPAHVTLKRQNPEPLRDLVENYDDLQEAFRDTKREQYFE